MTWITDRLPVCTNKVKWYKVRYADGSISLACWWDCWYQNIRGAYIVAWLENDEEEYDENKLLGC